MKVLLFDYGYYISPHLETEAEIIQRHLDRGDEVLRLVCKGELPVCVLNPKHNLVECVTCNFRRDAAMRLLSKRVSEKSVLRLAPRDRETIAQCSFDGQTFRDLKALTFETFDIGLAVASILVDEAKDPEPDVVIHGPRVREWLGVSLAAFLSARNILDEEKPDRVYVMNGRWSYTRAVLRACQERKIDCYLHERGGDRNRYWLSANVLPHELKPYHESVKKVWAAGDPAERESIGGALFEEKAKGVERQWHSFVTDQKKGKMPDGWDPARRNVAVFMSSEFEFAAIGPDYHNKLYIDQNDGLERILASLEAVDAPVHLWIRLHPNMRGIRNANLERTLAIRSPKATVIPPESPISSYALLWACEKVLTFGSTMGIEAVYWGKPSVLAGPSYYQGLGGTYNPDTHEEVVALLVAELQPKPREAALKYGYHELRKGVEHVEYKAESPFKGTFKGRDLNDSVPWHRRLYQKMLLSKQIRLSGAVARAGREHKNLACDRFGLPLVEDPQPSNSPPLPLHKRVVDWCIKRLFRFVLQYPTTQ
jgi:hypothetical protein